ncbi:hypothetical protein, partial [Lysinibacillus sp. OTC-L20]|uniref:hypothetical protein n=1 Tax=Lysinibacillus sp. OTC-L20 TaxID=3342791 RepID=UPI0035BB6CF4
RTAANFCSSEITNCTPYIRFFKSNILGAVQGSKVIEKRDTPLIRDNHSASHCEIKLQWKTLLHVAGKSFT